MNFEFKKSTRKNKKYMVKVDDRWIHFGQLPYEHFKDSTPQKIYSNLNHYDINRLKNYRKRAMAIKNKSGQLTYKLITSPNYWALKYLWS